ncbi:hydroxymethylbilane synthase [Iodobacter fluviatilis]|uniref:Porphobilinogen deaminase n=1 Tax=Iodobacter fluviatilis TaxID=537 RepID=A0A377SV61_9NEIS|nr:hydroxymethylbilane synthase [Iodobacter fluviatilis]TCU82029.1 hydroxymethylbilane synthase [Iodobacter fluviatilis]STR44877.1 Porphobilinogen deaminase [Iodobacter fluviatilis]
MTQPNRLVIATRESPLALWQANHVKARLEALYPELQVELLGMTTQGDRILDVTLNKIGGKGLFVKELETAITEGRADLAVHSMKDVPMVLPEGFTLAAIGEREDPRDAFVSNKYDSLDQLTPGCVVGTSSLRRESQLRARFPHLLIKPLRGNVGTRLGKLDAGEYDAIILASAGLIRLGLASRIKSAISPGDSLPSPGQGALGIEVRSDRADLISLLAPFNHAATAACVTAERSLSRRLGGSCQIPLGAFAEEDDGFLRLRAFIANPDGSDIIYAEGNGSLAAANGLGLQVAELLCTEGATEILKSLAAAAAE